MLIKDTGNRASPDMRLESAAKKAKSPSPSRDSQRPTVQPVTSSNKYVMKGTTCGTGTLTAAKTLSEQKTSLVGAFSTRNEKFMGRKEELKAIDECLNPQTRSRRQKSLVPCMA